MKHVYARIGIILLGIATAMAVAVAPATGATSLCHSIRGNYCDDFQNGKCRGCPGSCDLVDFDCHARKSSCELRKEGERTATSWAVDAFEVSFRAQQAVRSEPLPKWIKKIFKPFFPARVLREARVTTTRSFGGTSLFIDFLRTARAVTLGHIITLANPHDLRRGGAEDIDTLEMWAEELEHVKQYFDMGIDGFAEVYALDRCMAPPPFNSYHTADCRLEQAGRDKAAQVVAQLRFQGGRRLPKTSFDRAACTPGCESTDPIYVLGKDPTVKRLWRERGCQRDRDWVDDSVGSFQAVSTNDSYVLGADASVKRLWRVRGDMRTREWVDDSVGAFQAIDHNLVYVLGADPTVKRLWRVRGNMHNREWVDDSVGSFQAIDDNVVYVLGADSSVKRLWRIRGNMQNREWVDDSVGAFQAIDHNLVYVLGADSSVKRLWRVRGNMHNREWVDDSVGAFQAIDHHTVYILGADPSVKRLWRVRGNMHDREWVADGVEAFQAIDGNRVYVLRENGELWNVTGNWEDDAELVDRSVGSFQFPGVRSPVFASWHRPWARWPRVAGGGAMVCGPWCNPPDILEVACPPLTWGAGVNPGRPSTVTVRDPEGDLQSVTVTRVGGRSKFTSQLVTDFHAIQPGNSTAFFYPTCDCPGGSCGHSGSELSFVAHATDSAGGFSSVSFVCGCYP